MLITGLRAESPEFRAVVSISLSETSLSKADQLLQLASSTSTFQATLLGSAVILTAVALEQGIYSAAASCAANYAADHQVPFENAPAAILLRPEVSMNERIRNLSLLDNTSAAALSKNEIRLLRNLVGLRNSLVHIKEPPRLFTADSPGVTLREGLLTIECDFPTDPWSHVSLEQARQYWSTTKKLFDEVLFRAFGSVKLGKGWFMFFGKDVSDASE